MKVCRCLLFLLTVWCLSDHTLHAGSRTCRIVYPERPQSAPKNAFLFDGSTSRMVTLPSMNFSEVIDLPGGEINLLMTLTEISDPKALPVKAPGLLVSDDVNDFYIVLAHDSRNPEVPLSMSLISVGNGEIKAGETLWLNRTDHRIVAKLGNADMSVEPHGRTISRNPLQNSGYYQASLTYQVNGEGVPAPITEQNWWHDAQSRHLGFISCSSEKLPKIYYFRDFRPGSPSPSAPEEQGATGAPSDSP